jgi:GT2 family glycosyltransferase
MSAPRVSVVIPTRDREAFLREAVDSVLAGTFRDFEVIVVDDGSTDGTRGLVERYGDPVRYRRGPGRGVSAARNLGVSLARGRYVAFLDSDDRWEREKLRVQVDWMERHPGIRACQTEEVWIRDGIRRNPGKRHRKHGGEIFERCLPLCIISPSAVLIERALLEELGGFDETLPVCEDYDLWLRLSLRYPVGLVDEPLVVKRGGHADQLSRRYRGMDRFRIRALAGLILRGEVHGRRRSLVLHEVARKCRVVAGGARKRGREDEARAYEAIPAALERHPDPPARMPPLVPFPDDPTGEGGSDAA